jgi:uncharacterized protein YhbP (UPF0306 family)
MPIVQSKQRFAEARMVEAARRLVGASTLCAIATVGRGGSAHVHTAYFAFTPELELIWLSEPRAQHSRNVHSRKTVAIEVYDSRQVWGKEDCGIQLFGSARKLTGSDASQAEAVYAARFSEYAHEGLSAYRFYAFRPGRIKLFDERDFGAGRFVTARVGKGGRLTWEGTQIYRSVA